MTGDEASVRREVRSALGGREAGPAWNELQAARRAGEEPDPRPLYRLLGARRLLASAWPAAYGGRGLHPRCAAAVAAEMVAAGVPDTLHTLSVQICGSFLLGAGSPRQRAWLLPGLAAGARFCTVLYSEPEAGSDLAALVTRAEPAPGGGWRLTGRKVYSVKTRFADLALVAARTSSETGHYDGISLFLLPLDAPGVTIVGLPSLADEEFADVRLDAVELPAGAVVGPAGGAWPLITEALALERTGVDSAARAEAWLGAWLEKAGRERLSEHLRMGVGRLRSRTAASQALARRCVDQLAAGRVEPVQAAATKLWCSETARAVAWWCAEASGPRGLWAGPEEGAAAGGGLEAAYREAPGLTLSAGTSEMMLELVAGSGLPTPESEAPGEEPLARQLRQAVRGVALAHDEGDPVGEWWRELAELGVFQLGVPRERGGLGLGLEAELIACEELGRELLDAGLLDTLTAIDAILRAGAQHPAAGHLEAALAGRWRALLADARLPERPLPDPGRADALVLVLPDGAGLALVPPDHPGLEVRRRVTGAGPVATVRLAPGMGGGAAVLCRGAAADAVLAGGRQRRAAWLAGLAVACVAHSVRRARTRRQFGRALAENQAVAFRLARLAVRCEALRAQLAEAGGGASAKAVAGVLAEAGELALAASREALQLHGAHGLTDRSPVARHYLVAPLAIAGDRPPAELWTEAWR